MTKNKRLDVKGFEGLYQVNEIGQVRNRKGHIMRPAIKKDGYVNFFLHKNGIGYNFLGHRIVGYSFLDKGDLPIINHINGIRTDNRVKNLEWCNNSHNQKHSYINGRVGNLGKTWTCKKKI